MVACVLAPGTQDPGFSKSTIAVIERLFALISGLISLIVVSIN